MNNLFYPRLAASNLKKNRKIYLPYLLTCIGSVAMFYIICMLTMNSTMSQMIGGEMIVLILQLGCIIVGLFNVIFLFYSNSFLIKRRKKEFGLYNILGMEKRHISKMMLFESLYVTLISLTFGLALGILFSKLVFLCLLKLLNFEVVLGFEVPASAIAITLLLFCCIFLLTLVNNLRQIHLVNPVELLRGEQVGEKEPKVKWLAALLGTLSLAAGYSIALKTEEPISGLLFFFVAVLLVIIGTYLLFSAGSIALLKLLRKNKKFYYKTNHFISVSGMMYRMKQNAAGLANICILSTMVLVMVSGTVSLYIGMDDILTTRYPREIIISSDAQSAEEARQNKREEEIAGLVDPILDRHGANRDATVSYRYLSFSGALQENEISLEAPDLAMLDTVASIYVLPLEDYNASYGTDYQLESEQDALLYYNRTPYTYDTLNLMGTTYHLTLMGDDFVLNGFDSAQITSSYFLIVKDVDVMLDIEAQQAAVYQENASTARSFFGFDLPEADAQTKLAVYHDISAAIEESDLPSAYTESRESSSQSFFSLYGSLFFLGIFLGLLFIMATVLIIYYKQISEGFEDKDRFHIMLKVGMSHSEVKKAIHSQVLIVFFLPLLTAGVHICFAFSIITKLLALLQLTNVTLFFWCTLGTFLVFALFYALIYSFTAKAYYKIVS